MNEEKLPQSCEEHQSKYVKEIWKEYSLMELGSWVHLFAKRSQHRIDLIKKKKDLTDAQNYLDMMQSKLNALKEN